MKSVSGAQSAQRRLEDRPPCPQTHLFFLYLSQEHLVELAHDKGAFDLSLLMDPVPAGISSATGITPVPAGKLPGAWSCRPLMGNPAWGGGFTALGWAPWTGCQRVLPGLVSDVILLDHWASAAQRSPVSPQGVSGSWSGPSAYPTISAPLPVSGGWPGLSTAALSSACPISLNSSTLSKPGLGPEVGGVWPGVCLAPGVGAGGHLGVCVARECHGILD